MSGLPIQWDAMQLAASGCDLTDSPQPSRQICAWCLAEGVLTVIREGGEPTSHGICAHHAQQMLNEGAP